MTILGFLGILNQAPFLGSVTEGNSAAIAIALGLQIICSWSQLQGQQEESFGSPSQGSGSISLSKTPLSCQWKVAWQNPVLCQTSADSDTVHFPGQSHCWATPLPPSCYCWLPSSPDLATNSSLRATSAGHLCFSHLSICSQLPTVGCLNVWDSQGCLCVEQGFLC